jgi:putative glutamine transport system permease protein
MFQPEAWAALFRDYRVFAYGLLATLQMAFFGFIMAFILGVLFGLCATGNKKSLRILNRIYIEFFQNTPLMLQALFLFYAVTFSDIGGLTPLTAGSIALGIYHGAYFSEVIRSGIEAIPKGQFEAAYSQGFTYLQTMRYVIVPQTTMIILPPMVNQVVALIKNTSCMLLVGGAVDLISTTNAYAVGMSTGRYGPAAYVFSGIVFFLICFPLSTIASRWEQCLKQRDSLAAYTQHKQVDEVTDEELDAIIQASSHTKGAPFAPQERAQRGEGK